MKKKVTEKQHPFMKMAGIKNMKDFMSKYPTEDDFFADYPQAKYGMLIKATDGASTGQYQIGQYVPGLGYWTGSSFASKPPDPNWHPPMVTPTEEEDEQRKKLKLKISGGGKTWNPLKKDNAWNTGKGFASNEGIAKGVAITAGALPFMPGNANNAKPNINIGNYGTGSHAAFEDGGQLSPAKAREMLHNPPHGQPLSEKQRKYFGAVASGYAADGIQMPEKSTVKGKSMMKNSTAPNDSRYESAFVTVNEYPNKVNDTSYSYMSGQPGMEQNIFYNTQIDPSTGKPISVLNRNGMVGEVPADSVNYYRNKISNIAGFEDGGPMITEVVPSAHTYFRPMTKQGRQVPETPNFIAEDGMSMPVTDADRQAYNNYVIGMRKLPGYDSVNWQHDQNFQKQAAQQLGFDYSKAAAIQADMKARNEAMPGSIKGVQPGDAWGGDPTWVGNRERQKEYIKNSYEHIDSKGNVIGYIPSGFNRLTNEQFTSWADQNRARTAPQTNLPPTTNPMDPAYVAPGTPAAPVSRETGLAATGFPTREEALAKYNARKASGQELPGNYFEKETRKQRRARETGDPIGMVRTTGEDVYKYGGPLLGGYDAKLNQNYPYPMTNQYPHKIGGQYHPYDHTYMEHGGMVPIGEHGLQVEGNQFRYLSPQTIELVGPKHSQGGIDIAYNGNKVEAEGGETFHVDNNGMWSGGNMAEDGTASPGIVGGNLYVPGTKTKFKDAFKNVAKQERSADKLQDTASYFLNSYGQVDKGPKNKYTAPAFNYGIVKADEYEQTKAKNEMVKKQLTDVQNKMLELGGMIDPENGAKTVSQMFKGKGKWGAKMTAKYGAQIAKNGANMFDSKYDALLKNAKGKLQQMFPGSKVEIKQISGNRDVSTQREKKASGVSETDVSLHNYGAARDYHIYVDGKFIDNSRHDVYDNTLWKAAEEIGLYHLDPQKFGKWDPYHIGVVHEDGKTTTTRLLQEFPELADTPEFKRTYDYLQNRVNAGDSTEQEAAVWKQIKSWTDTNQNRQSVKTPVTNTRFGIPGKEPMYMGEYQGQNIQRATAPATQSTSQQMTNKGDKDSVADWFEGEKYNPNPSSTRTNSAPTNSNNDMRYLFGGRDYSVPDYRKKTVTPPAKKGKTTTAPVQSTAPVQNVATQPSTSDDVLNKIKNETATVAEIKDYNKKTGFKVDIQNGIDYDPAIHDEPESTYEKTKDYDEFLDILGQNPEIDYLPIRTAPSSPNNAGTPRQSVDVPAMPDFISSTVDPLTGLEPLDTDTRKKGKGLTRAKYKTDLSALRDAFEQVDPYQSVQLQPYLESDYYMSLQQKKNVIQSAFAPALKAARTPAEKAAISAQMAEQLGAVDSEEFQFNQQNREGIKARNVQEMRNVRDTNMKLAMDAYDKTLGGKEATRQIRRAAEAKMRADKAAVDAENRKLEMYENYGGWYDKDGKWIRTLAPQKLKASTPSVYDPTDLEDEETSSTTTTTTDPVTGEKTTTKQKAKKDQQYYGGPIAYFGVDMPAGIPRIYFGGGPVGGAAGGMGHGGGMHGMPGYTGSMASRYSPGGDSSYYQKKKKKKKTT